jgi:CRISPR-associated exonuclease Cas4
MSESEAPEQPEQLEQLEIPEYLPISFLNALVYCPRRFYYEFAWGEMLLNEHVVQGQVYHQNADAGGASITEDAVTIRRVYVYSERLHIAGLIDVVEAPLDPQDPADPKIEEIASAPFYPVEYKKGSAHGGALNDHVQLCAQGLCLEERTGVTLPGGYVFSFGTMRRTWIAFTPELRAATEATVAEAFALLQAGRLPPPLPERQARKCRECSLEPLCLPREVRALGTLAASG